MIKQNEWKRTAQEIETKAKFKEVQIVLLWILKKTNFVLDIIVFYILFFKNVFCI